FLGIATLRKNVELVCFRATEELPFRRAIPAATEPPPRSSRMSQFVRVEEHRNYLRSPVLQGAFEQLANCFLDATDSRREWVYVNPKTAHVAVHYKGEYIICLWARQSRLDVYFRGDVAKLTSASAEGWLVQN